MEQLPLFENQPVAKSTLRVTKAGDGLSEALDLEPQALKLGEEVCFVLKGHVTQVNHRSADNVVVRQHTIETTGIAPIDAETADNVIATEKARLGMLRDERSGQTRTDEPLAIAR